jgi:hypothetical protein
MQDSPSRHGQLPLTRQRIITTYSPEFSVSSIGVLARAVSSAVWFSANDAVAYPFRVSYGAIVDQLCIANGSSAGGQFDLGIYDGATLARLVSTGSTGGSGNNAWQFVDVTNTPLQPFKLYYLAAVRDNVTANRQRIGNHGSVAQALSLAGVLSNTTDQFPLPDPIVLTTTTTTSIQMCGFACRAPF